jgi:uncharacterized membrane protein
MVMPASMLPRLFRHLLGEDWAARRAFPEPVLERITAAIASGEQCHSGELRFVVEGGLPPVCVLRGQTARQRAEELFGELRVWDTEHNSGVLIYLLMADRSVEILADRGVSARVPPGQWQAICKAMEQRYALGEFERGAVEGIEAVSDLLAAHFPADAVNPNELPDRPVIM